MKYVVAIILAVSLFGWRIFTLIPEERDPYYLKFTKGNFKGLIIGSSRTAQGIIPSRIAPAIYNYSFNSIIAPYGPAYERAISGKVSPDARGPFIIEVNPSLLALSPIRERADVFTFPEDEGFLAKMWFSELDPNPEYVLRSRRTPAYRTPMKDPLKLHEDGWLEIPPNQQHEWMKKNGVMVNSYERLFRTHALSEKRITYLKSIVKSLSTRGEVFLIRMPTSPEVTAVEDKYFPGFDGFLTKLAHESGVRPINLFRMEGLVTKDGDHLTKDSAEKVSDLIRSHLDLPR